MSKPFLDVLPRPSFLWPGQRYLLIHDSYSVLLISLTMPFYTLAFWRGANRNLNQVRAGNYLIVTPDRDAANLLYRFIHDEHKAMQIKRSSPQYWTFHGDLDIRDVFQGILCGGIAINNKRFESVRDSFFFHQFQSNDLFYGPPSLPEIPHIDAPDYISGVEVYIRSKRMPDQYWSWINHGLDCIILSEDEPTKFRIEYAKDPSDRETLLVNDDDVVVSAFQDNGIVPLFVFSDGRLLYDYDERQTSFKFGALLHGLCQVDEGRKYPMVVHKEEEWVCREEWELV